MMLGGDESFGVGGYYHTPVEEALPVTMEARQKVGIPSLAMALVIDRSGSMRDHRWSPLSKSTSRRRRPSSSSNSWTNGTRWGSSPSIPARVGPSPWDRPRTKIGSSKRSPRSRRAAGPSYSRLSRRRIRHR